MKFLICNHCKNIITYVEDQGVPVVCCGEPMSELIANTTDGAQEKHVPVVTTEGNTVTVVVGSTEHPMLDEHHISWIALETKNGTQIKYLDPTGTPKCQFSITDDDEVLAVYEYCNLHGLWKA